GAANRGVGLPRSPPRSHVGRSLMGKVSGMARPDMAMVRGRFRYVFLVLAAAASSVVAATLSLTGLSYVNLDSLLHEAGAFYACLVVPASLVVIALVLATVPRLPAIGLTVFVGTLLLAEPAASSPPPPPPPTPP